jgi:CheY-like chemotaxis protein
VLRAGLCDTCVHQQVVRTRRGSAFSLCRRSRTDPAYPKYPRIPVLACVGHEPRGDQARGRASSR